MTSPSCPFAGLDSLWIQVAGLACNMRCVHCFNRSGPDNRELPFLSRDGVSRLLDDAAREGARDVVFTGGEPFLHPEMAEIAADSLARFPTTVLTNGTLITERIAGVLSAAQSGSRFSLEIRISLDAPNGADNDRIRGAGSFERALAGAERLERAGILPIVTAVAFAGEDAAQALEEFERLLRGRGFRMPRVKFLPVFRIGREEARSGGYGESDRVTREMLDPGDASQLLCSGARLVSARGVWPCPVLLGEPGARMGERLEESFRPFRLAYGACSTCLLHGSVCANAAVAVREE